MAINDSLVNGLKKESEELMAQLTDLAKILGEPIDRSDEEKEDIINEIDDWFAYNVNFVVDQLIIERAEFGKAEIISVDNNEFFEAFDVHLLIEAHQDFLEGAVEIIEALRESGYDKTKYELYYYEATKGIVLCFIKFIKEKIENK